MFTANDGVNPTGLWRTDGTEAGTFRIQSFNINTPPGVMNNEMYYEGSSKALWKTDGTLDGTVKIKDMPTSAFSKYFTMGDYFIFLDNEKSLWRSDGTSDGTTKIFNLVDVTSITNPQIYSTYKAGNLCYLVIGGSSSIQLWRTDGTGPGTAHVKTLDFPILKSDVTPILGVANNLLLFRAYDSTHGFELWSTDGTENGTKILKDVLPGSASSFPLALYNDGSNLFFVANDNDLKKYFDLEIERNS